MAHTHPASTHDDAVLAAFLEPGALADIAARVNMSLASLANWAARHADLLNNLHHLLTTRCKLIAAHVELAALSALAAVSSSTTNTDDPTLRERALERQRKAAGAILRHKTSLERAPRASVAPHAPTHARGTGVQPVPTPSTSLASSNAECLMPNAASLAHAPPLASMPFASMPFASMPSSIQTKKPSIAQRLAARRLAAIAQAHERQTRTTRSNPRTTIIIQAHAPIKA